MAENIKKIELKGRVFLTFDIQTMTGLHIGGSDTGIEIGGVDKTVIRDPLTQRPYIPGSSLKGKMRSLLEKYRGLKQNQRIGQGYIHSCGAEYKKEKMRTKGREEYQKCDVCQVFGVPGERVFSTPTRLVVRDVHMSDKSAAELEASGRTDLPYTQVKSEVSIDRVTSAANPRQMERIPAGVIFGGTRKMQVNGSEREVAQPAELIYSIYSGDDCDPIKDVKRLATVVEGLQLLEDDYLGGLGSRGSGKVCFQNIIIRVRTNDSYLDVPQLIAQYDNLHDLVANLTKVLNDIQKTFGLS